jgi:hypothetical protein
MSIFLFLLGIVLATECLLWFISFITSNIINRHGWNLATLIMTTSVSVVFAIGIYLIQR